MDKRDKREKSTGTDRGEGGALEGVGTEEGIGERGGNEGKGD